MTALRTILYVFWTAVIVYVVYLAYNTLKNFKGMLPANATDLVNPTSDKNIAYQGANRIAGAFTGYSGEVVGTALYNAVNGDEFDRLFNQPVSFDTVVNPADNDLAQFGVAVPIMAENNAGAVTGRILKP